MPDTTYTFGDLKAELRLSLFPTGEAVNLVAPHNQMFVEALVNLQQYVECLTVNNIQLFPQCNTLFRCGMTVIDKPRGRMNALYVLDKINQDTGREDGDVATDWCSRVDYRYVEYSDLDRYVSQSLANSIEVGGFGGWFSDLIDSVASQIVLPGCSWNKYSFPPPDDEGLSTAPPLPTGFHYGQSSTDAPHRSQWGMWAIKGGQIFIAPWIQSTETIVLEWDGIKRTWNDIDLVDNDPILKQAVEAYVQMEHERKYGHDQQIQFDAQQKWIEKRQDLMYECAREQESRARGEKASAAGGASLIVPTFTNDAQSATATCPSNYTGNAVSYTVPAGTVVSTTSVADANSRAQSLALQTAGAQLDCTIIPVTYPNTIQSYTANCISAQGNPVTRTVQPGTIQSLISVDDANATALAQATQEAISALSCTYFNTAQSYTASCPSGSSGADVTKTVPANSYSSTVSQAEADRLALTEATNQANTALVCNITPTIHFNTEQSATVSGYCSYRGTLYSVTATATIPAGAVTSLVSVNAANAAAAAAAQQAAQAQYGFKCAHGIS